MKLADTSISWPSSKASTRLPPAMEYRFRRAAAINLATGSSRISVEVMPSVASPSLRVTANPVHTTEPSGPSLQEIRISQGPALSSGHRHDEGSSQSRIVTLKGFSLACTILDNENVLSGGSHSRTVMSMDSSTSQPTLTALHGRATITVEEAARILGIGRSAAYEAVRRHEIPSLRLGRRLVVPVPRFLAMLGWDAA